MQVLSQQQEAELGYATAVALSELSEVIAWDSGGGEWGQRAVENVAGASFQITTRREGLESYLGPLGTGVVTSILAPRRR